MKTYIGVLFFSIALLSSCNQTDSKKTDSKTDQTITQEEATSNKVIPVSETNSEAVKTTQTASGMNPPHGQPGHDCAVAVGAPLNNSSPVINSGSSSPVLQTASGMNPPHGQKGHDCAIAVGAPLNK